MVICLVEPEIHDEGAYVRDTRERGTRGIERQRLVEVCVATRNGEVCVERREKSKQKKIKKISHEDFLWGLV